MLLFINKTHCYFDWKAVFNVKLYSFPSIKTKCLKTAKTLDDAADSLNYLSSALEKLSYLYSGKNCQSNEPFPVSRQFSSSPMCNDLSKVKRKKKFSAR